MNSNTILQEAIEDQDDDQDDDIEFMLLLFVVQAAQICIQQGTQALRTILDDHIREQRRLVRALPVKKRRPTWDHFSSQLSEVHFRRMFRMTLPAFTVLCSLIRSSIGKENFRSEWQYPQEENVTTPTIPGEIKVAVSICMLAGGSYLDLGPLFNIATSYLYEIFDDFIAWILKTLQFPLAKWLREKDWSPLLQRANEFAEKSGGIFYGPLGALDGLAVRIRCPWLSEVPDPGNYYCRKGFYALNVQAICDKSKRFLWCYPSNKGSTHDSAAFASSRLYELLKEVAEDLHRMGLFIAADSAYTLASFTITPYDSDQTGRDDQHRKDAFNYHLSSCRIFIECAFGELVMRWGILWRTLAFDLKKSAKIVQVCMLLHNFIVDSREDDQAFFRNFNIRMDRIQQEITRQTGEIPRPLVTDNNEPLIRGRPTNNEQRLRSLALETRHRLTVSLAVNDMLRPMEHDMHYNQYGHIYITS